MDVKNPSAATRSDYTRYLRQDRPTYLSVLRKHAWHIAAIAFAGLAAGLLTGTKIPAPQPDPAFAAVTTAVTAPVPPAFGPNRLIEARKRADSAKAELEKALQETGGADYSSELQTAPTSGLLALQDEIVEAETARLNDEDRQSADLEQTQHREDLLRITFRARLASLPADQQKPARISFLRAESELADRTYKVLSEGHGTAIPAESASQQPAARSGVRREAAVRTVASGTVGALLASTLGFSFFLYRDRARRKKATGPVFPADAIEALLAEIDGFPAPKPGMQPAKMEPAPELTQAEQIGAALLASPDAPSAKTAPTLAGTRHGVIPVVASASHGLSFVVDQDIGDGFPQSREVFFGNRWSGSSGPLEEACRDVIYSVLLADWGKGIRSYAIVSPGERDGKTTVLSNIALALGRAQLRIVMVDANLQHPGIHELFEVPNSKGLQDILTANTDLDKISIEDIALRTRFSHIAVVPAGAKDVHPEWARSARFAALIERLTREFDLVLVDTASGPAGEAPLVATHCGGVIQLLRAGVTTDEAAASLYDELRQHQAYVAGLCLNRFEKTDQSGYFDNSSSPYGEQKSARI